MYKPSNILLNLFVIVIFCLCEPSLAESEFTQEFNKFSNHVGAEFEYFSVENEEQFAQQLLKEWQRFNQALIRQPSKIIKPKQQPASITESQYSQSHQNDQWNAHKKVSKLEESFDNFYGHQISINIAQGVIKPFTGNNPLALVDYRQYLISNKTFNHLLVRYHYYIKALTSDHWASTQLAQHMCSLAFSQGNSISVCVWVLLHSLSVDARIAQTGRNWIVLLSSDQGWLQQPYFQLGQNSLYVFDRQRYAQQKSNGLAFHKQAYPQAIKKVSIKPSTGLKPSLFRLEQGEHAILGNKLKLDIDHLSYIHKQPMQPISVYLRDNIPQYLVKQFLPSLHQIGNKKDKIAWVLNWVQDQPYQTDHEQFGYEKPMTLSELFYYKASDCEDRVYAFSAILASLNILQIAALEYPNHLSAAVLLDEQWLEADPTYKGAGLGMAQPAFKAIQPIWYH